MNRNAVTGHRIWVNMCREEVAAAMWRIAEFYESEKPSRPRTVGGRMLAEPDGAMPGWQSVASQFRPEGGVGLESDRRIADSGEVATVTETAFRALIESKDGTDWPTRIAVLLKPVDWVYAMRSDFMRRGAQMVPIDDQYECESIMVRPPLGPESKHSDAGTQAPEAKMTGALGNFGEPRPRGDCLHHVAKKYRQFVTLFCWETAGLAARPAVDNETLDALWRLCKVTREPAQGHDGR